MTGASQLDRRSALRAGAGLVAGGLAAVAGVGAAPLLGGCRRPGRGSLEIAVGWSGAELDRFRQVCRGYPRRVQITPVGDDVDAFLRVRHRAGTLPDVAVVPRPGLVRAYARRGWLEPLDDLTERFPSAWNEWVEVDGHLYGAWLRAAQKSLFWYLPSQLSQPIPGTWDELVALVRDLAAEVSRDHGPAPLAVGAADGWVLTDWLDNLLAARADQRLYADLAAGEPRWGDAEVRQALADLAEIWGIRDAFPGGGERALLTQFDQSVVQVVATREATLLYEGDFVRAQAERFQDDFVRAQAERFQDDAPDVERLEPFPFPSPTDRSPRIVGGDAAVVLAGSSAGRDLVEWLTGDADAFATWRAAGGYLSPNLWVPDRGYPTDLEPRLVRQITEPEPDVELRFDLSDLLPGELNGADGVGTWQVLQDFFAHVTGRRDEREVDAAIDTAVGSLNDIARRVAEQADPEVVT